MTRCWRSAVFMLRYGLTSPVVSWLRRKPHALKPRCRRQEMLTRQFICLFLSALAPLGASAQWTGDAYIWLVEYKFTRTRPRFELGSVTIENTFATQHLVTGLGFRL